MLSQWCLPTNNAIWLPAKRWLAFLRNHREAIAAMDFFTVPTVTLSVIYCFFLIPRHSSSATTSSAKDYNPLSLASIIVIFPAVEEIISIPKISIRFFLAVQAIRAQTLPKYLSSDHDPLYRFHQWRANLRILEVQEIKNRALCSAIASVCGETNRMCNHASAGPSQIVRRSAMSESGVLSLRVAQSERSG